MKKNSLRFLAVFLASLVLLTGVLRPHTKNFGTAVVAKVSLTAQTTLPTSITTIFTSTSSDDTDYRVSVYIANPSQVSSSTFGTTIYWTDELGGGSNGCAAGTLTTQNGSATNAEGSCVVHLASGDAIKYQVTGSGATPDYDLFITVEEM